MMDYQVFRLLLLIIGGSTVIAENDDDNVTLSTVVVSIYPSTTYYNIIERDNVYITCSANCDPPCQYQWYHPNFQVNGSVLSVNVTKEMDFQLYGPIFCLASNEESGPFISPEIRMYVFRYVSFPKWIDIEEGEILSLCLLDNPADCNGGCYVYLYDPMNQYHFGNCYSMRGERYNTGRWYWRWYYKTDYYFYFTINVYITPSYHVMIPNVRNLTVNSSCTREIGPIRFVGRCNPPCTYVWYKNDSVYSFGNTLYIDNVNQSNSGYYECRVYNGTEMIDSTTVDIHVFGTSFMDTECNDIQVLGATTRNIGNKTHHDNECNMRPDLETYRNRNFTSHVSYTSTQYLLAEFGRSLTLECTAACHPECSHFRWYYPKGTYDGQKLYIPSVDESYDSTPGINIFCIAWNDCFTFHSSSNVFINVTYGPRNVKLTPDGSISVLDGSSTGFITVEADCNPPCIYRLIYLSEYKSYFRNIDSFETTVSKGSEGIWEWHVWNNFGSVRRSFKVLVWESHQLIPYHTNYSINTSKCIEETIGPIRFIGYCNPNCTYVWFKNGVPLSIGNTLLINNVNGDDSGEYHCVAYNKLHNITSASISINVTELDDSNYTLQEYQANVGEQFGPVNCTLSLTTPVKWKSPRGTVYSNPLVITTVTSDDFGEYKCINTDEKEDACQIITLLQKSQTNSSKTCDNYSIDSWDGNTLNYSIQTSHNSFKNISLKEGSMFEATCYADCYPECIWFRWYFPGGSSDGRTLRLSNVNMSFHYAIGGQLYCLAWNDCKWPQSSRGILLNVGFGPRNIVFNATESVYTVSEGDSLGPFICTADCKEACAVHWYGRQHIYQTILYFPKVFTSIDGSWHCYLYNSFGNIYAGTFRINVKHGPKNPAIFPKSIFTYDFRNTTDPELPPITCSAECDPTCTFIWYKNKKFFSNANVLQIPNVGPNDHGKYHCYAFNEFGNYTFQTVEIVMFDNPTYIMYEPDQRSYELKIGDHLGPINCSADCNPKCEYYWSTPTGPIRDRVLNISITSPVQGGEYVCHAVNANYEWPSEPVYVDTDPCSDINYSPLSDYAHRSQGSKISSAPLCDNHIEENWYRAGFTDIPTEPPSMFACGTTYPIWINGSIPADRRIVEIQACARGLYSDCDYSFQISVKNCGDYRVYLLKPTNVCPSAYCLDTRDEDPPTGLVESAVVSVSHIQWLKSHPRAGRYKKKPILWFKCEFPRLADSELFYSINWYVDQELVVKDQTVAPIEPPVGYMSGEEIRRLSAKVYCSVGAKKYRLGAVGEMRNSATFFAGLRVKNHNINFQRGSSVTLEIEQTVPFACDENVIEDRQKSIPNPSDCQISLELIGERTLTVCGQCTRITGFTGEDDYMRNNGSWTRTYGITICHKDDGSIDRSVTDYSVYFHTSRIYTDNIWNNAISPLLVVRIYEPLENQWKSRYCYDLLDPHLRTFDGRKYQSHINGKYLLYRNNNTLQEVHVIHRPCFGSREFPKCVCGVAARAGRDVFIINICDRNNLIEFTLCDDGALSVTKASERNYNVHFPSGTSVSISIRTSSRPYWINMNIYPSPSDQFSVDGLCSNLDGRIDNDFTPRYSNVPLDVPYDSSYPDTFSESWRLNPSEDLFNEDRNVYSGLKSLKKTTLNKFCNCGSIHVADCNYENQQVLTKYKQKQVTCNLKSDGSNRRRKRSISAGLLGARKSVVFENLKRHRRSTQSNNNYTEEEARTYCEQTMNSSVVYSECLSTITSLDHSHSDSCTADLQMSGDVSLAKPALESFLETCSTYTQKNITLQEDNANFIDIILSLCPTNCSENGECYDGNCTCFENFAGADCSFELHSPPVINSITNNGTYDFSEDECNDVSFFGEFFMEDTNSTCKYEETKVFGDGSRLHVANWTSTGSARTIFEGVCPIQYSNINFGKDYVTELSVAYSNDAQVYSEHQRLILYDSDCQGFNTTGGGNITIEMKNEYCFIEGRCFLRGDNDTRRGNCFICDPVEDIYDWTFKDNYCLINDSCVPNGGTEDSFPCNVCNTSDKGINTWSLNPGYCVINNTYYKDGDTKEGSECKFCDSTTTSDSWKINDTFCLINDECVQNGNTNSSFKCHICDIDKNNTNWTINKNYCLIDGNCYAHDETQNNTVCHICNNATPDSWSVTPSFCEINNTCYTNNEENPDDSCRFCNASVQMNYKWSNNESLDCSSETSLTSTQDTKMSSEIPKSSDVSTADTTWSSIEASLETVPQSTMGETTADTTGTPIKASSETVPQSTIGETTVDTTRSSVKAPSETVPQGTIGETTVDTTRSSVKASSETVPQGTIGETTVDTTRSSVKAPSETVPQSTIGETTVDTTRSSVKAPSETVPQGTIGETTVDTTGSSVKAPSETVPWTTIEETTADITWSSVKASSEAVPQSTKEETTADSTGSSTEASLDNAGISELFKDKALYIGASAGVVLLAIPIIVIVIVQKLRNNASKKRRSSNKSRDSGSLSSTDSTYQDTNSWRGTMESPYHKPLFGQNHRIPRASLSSSSNMGPFKHY